MDENQNQYNSSQDPYKPDKSGHALAGAAFALALLSVFSCMIIYISLPAGALAITLALLSRGKGPMKGRCKAAVYTGITGCLITTIVTGSAAYMVLTNPVLRRQAQQIVEYYNRQDQGKLSDYFFEDEKQPATEKETAAADKKIELKTAPAQQQDTEKPLESENAGDTGKINQKASGDDGRVKLHIAGGDAS